MNNSFDLAPYLLMAVGNVARCGSLQKGSCSIISIWHLLERCRADPPDLGYHLSFVNPNVLNSLCASSLLLPPSPDYIESYIYNNDSQT
jgi:hypothetical protein